MSQSSGAANKKAMTPVKDAGEQRSGMPAKKVGGAKGGMKTKSVMKSTRAGISFPVGRIQSMLRRGRYAKNVGPGLFFV
jgi:hypothetical protein